MAPWEVDDQPRMKKGVKSIRGNERATKNLISFLEELKICKDPADIGERKSGSYRNCYGVHLTKSVSLIYRIDYKLHTVYLIDIGDHKRLYGRDGRS